ncbi:hypothetical protein C900_04932 [Fulvivirga imtechensis AK7]|uniref:Phospholipase/carboxylesterase/thioesterase domain-containing protein n=2 Tax=Fulvivirga TaxID=396811 RepID=L8JPW1_9BACT|nr:hypothetical protein C900_04932 [Fulvivirga imtechensis AK7]
MTQDRSAFESKHFINDGDTLLYRILWPENFDKSKKYPLVIFLHGAGERGNDNKKQLVHGSSLFMEKRSNHPAIVIFPQCPKEDYWSSIKSRYNNGEREFYFEEDSEPTNALKNVSDLLDALLHETFVNTRQVYIAGLSMGGMGTYELVGLRPETFAAAFAICGAGNPKMAKKYAEKVPFWIFHGAKDDVVPPRGSEVMVEALKKEGGDVKYTLYPNANHNSWDSAFAEPELLPWLFSNKK